MVITNHHRIWTLCCAMMLLQFIIAKRCPKYSRIENGQCNCDLKFYKVESRGDFSIECIPCIICSEKDCLGRNKPCNNLKAYPIGTKQECVIAQPGYFVNHNELEKKITDCPDNKILLKSKNCTVNNECICKQGYEQNHNGVCKLVSTTNTSSAENKNQIVIKNVTAEFELPSLDPSKPSWGIIVALSLLGVVVLLVGVFVCYKIYRWRRKRPKPPRTSSLPSTCSSGISDQLLEGFLLEHLRDHSKFQRLIDILDTDGDWEFLFEKFPSLNRDVLYYKQCMHGGGNVASIWFEDLLSMKPREDLTMEKFKRNLRKVERLDIVDYVNDLELATLRDLTHSQKEKITNLLNKDNYGDLKCWKDVAKLYDFTNDQVENIDRKKIIPKKFSPSKEFLGDVIKSKNDLSLSEFCKAIEDSDMKYKSAVFQIIKDFVGVVEETNTDCGEERILLSEYSIVAQ